MKGCESGEKGAAVGRTKFTNGIVKAQDVLNERREINAVVGARLSWRCSCSEFLTNFSGNTTGIGIISWMTWGSRNDCKSKFLGLIENEAKTNICGEFISR